MHPVRVAKGHVPDSIRITVLADVKNETFHHGPVSCLLQRFRLSLSCLHRHSGFSKVENQRSGKGGPHESEHQNDPPRLLEVPNSERAINQVWTADFPRGPAPPGQEPQWRENKYQRDENENVNRLGAHKNAPDSGPEIIRWNGFFTHRQISFPFYPITSPSRPSRDSSFSPSAPVARR